MPHRIGKPISRSAGFWMICFQLCAAHCQNLNKLHLLLKSQKQKPRTMTMATEWTWIDDPTRSSGRGSLLKDIAPLSHKKIVPAFGFIIRNSGGNSAGHGWISDAKSNAGSSV